LAHRKTSPSRTAATTAPPLAQSILELVGATPMLRLNRYAPAGGAGIYAKLEFLNPGGSVKDRAALGMVDAAEAEGRLRPGATII
jgi:cysteine synthase A